MYYRGHDGCSKDVTVTLAISQLLRLSIFRRIKEALVSRVGRLDVHLDARRNFVLLNSGGCHSTLANDCLIATHATLSGMPLLRRNRDLDLLAGVEPKLMLVVAEQ
jgi:predicted nucleic acid-binding protein